MRAKITMRAMAVFYSVFKLVYYFADKPDFVPHRAVISAVLIVGVFVITELKFFSAFQLSVIIPLSIVFIELPFISFTGGDPLTYIFLPAVPLICFIYLDLKGLTIVSIVTMAFTVLLVVGFDVRMLGGDTTFYDDMFNIVGVGLIYIVIYLIARFTYNSLQSHQKLGQTFNAVLETSPNYIIITDKNGMVEYISNSAAYILFSDNPEDSLGKPLANLSPHETLNAFFASLLGRLETAQNVHETFELEADDKKRWFIIQGARFGDRSLVDATEITPIVQMQKEAEAATRSKSEFLATMSHEIRTPLNAILGISQITLQKENLPAGYYNDMTKIYGSGRNLLSIINDILDLSKIETGKLTIIPVEYSTADLVRDTVYLNLVRIGSKRLDFVLDISEDLPAKMKGDELRIKQIVNNLLSNAIKYTDNGKIRLGISHRVVDGKIELKIIVKDSGQGIREEDLPRLFTEYVRFNTAVNYETEGTGLGLTITKRLVEMMGGTIEVVSEYEMGTMFTITLLQDDVGSEPLGAETAAQLKSFSYAGEQMQRVKEKTVYTPYPDAVVLVVDDMETNLYVAEGMLDLYEVEMYAALSGFKALELIESGKTYDIIFMDHMMPAMDGVETTKRLRANGYTGTIIALTANAIVGNAEMFRENGFDDFMPKPMDAEKLGDALAKWLPS